MPFEDTTNNNDNSSQNNNTQKSPDISYVSYAEDNNTKWDFSSMSVNKPAEKSELGPGNDFDIEAAVRNAYPSSNNKTQKTGPAQNMSQVQKQELQTSQPRPEASNQKRVVPISNLQSGQTTAAQQEDAKKSVEQAHLQAAAQETKKRSGTSKLTRKQPTYSAAPDIAKTPEKEATSQQPSKKVLVKPDQRPSDSHDSQKQYQTPASKDANEANAPVPTNKIVPETQTQPVVNSASPAASFEPKRSTVNDDQFIPKLAVNPEKVSSAMEDRLSMLQNAGELQSDFKDDKGKKKKTSKFALKKKDKKTAPLSEDEWQGNFDEVISDFQAQDLEQQRKEALAQIPKGERIKNNIIAAIKEPVVIIAIIIVLFVVFVQKSFLVPSGSMVPTLIENDRIFTIKSYITNGQTFKPGDIVCFYAPGTNSEVYVKRVIANGGSTVEISGDEVYVDGELSPYQGKGTGQVQGKWELAEDEYFVMGDNRSNSKDSRYSEVGKIPASAMISRVVAIYWPFDDAKLLLDNPYPSES